VVDLRLEDVGDVGTVPFADQDVLAEDQHFVDQRAGLIAVVDDDGPDADVHADQLELWIHVSVVYG